ncbi:MAG: PilN domain-containing protein [Pegethrix bostrychoides GSE-TBD4-15B]|jgi:type IV pilus assembly protein PilN|uniref:PilN domain-containing protein n=1 Tax=Pegethrix bostrychoides GSE-TBD4-15B TaxID=2839662 RepID=A0A951PGP3_9CYAN|nr:PilN domain-containing protein [Pegethrix bostrychoides GSE-TBD4-15B]
MYSLDINFLNDRTERPTEAGLAKGRGGRVASGDPRAYYIGAALAIALPALVAGFWLFLQNQNSQLETRQAELDSQLVALQAQLAEVSNINTQVQNIEAENQALASVFDFIKPWSAILQDVRARVPSGVQIAKIEQLEPEPLPPPPPSPSPSPEASPSPGAAAAPAPVEVTPPPNPSRVAISGVARSFNDANDFVLTLQRSPFLKGDEIKLVSSKLIDNPTTVEFSEQNAGGNIEVQLPQVVEYRIEGSLTNLPASDLLQDLERTLSVGLASRIQALRDRGVLQP